MDSNVCCPWLEMIQTGANGILAMFATGNDRPNLFEIFIANERFDFGVSVFACDHDDFIDTAATLKCADCMGNNRYIGDRRKQFVETHAATVTGGDEDGGQHDWSVEALNGCTVEARKAALTLKPFIALTRHDNRGDPSALSALPSTPPAALRLHAVIPPHI